MRPKDEWAIDSEAIRARGIIVKYIVNAMASVEIFSPKYQHIHAGRNRNKLVY